MVPDLLQALLRHMEWADAVVWSAVLALPEARDDRRIRDTLYHAHTVQWAYLQIWRDEPLDIPEASSFENIDAVRDWCREYSRQVPQLLDGLDADALQRRIEFPWAEQLVERFGRPMPASFAETILQVTSHSTYHRGQANTRLRKLGAEPPLTDFIAWIWMGRPAADWQGSTSTDR